MNIPVKEFFRSGRTLAAKQRWYYDDGYTAAYIAEILPDTTIFKVVQIIKGEVTDFTPWLYVGGFKQHSSLTKGGSYWSYLPGQDAETQFEQEEGK